MEECRSRLDGRFSSRDQWAGSRCVVEVSVQLRLSFVKGGPSWRPRSTTHVRRSFLTVLSFWFLSLLMISWQRGVASW